METLNAINSSAKKNDAKNISISRKTEGSEKGKSRSVQRAPKEERSPLIDITNDSPIVGLAAGALRTPVSTASKRRCNRCKTTPGSGEALLRGQVKTLLQKVEEEGGMSKLSLQNRTLLSYKGLASTPMAVLAPTPVNTPQVFSFSGEALSVNDEESPIEDQLKISQLMNGTYEENNKEITEFEITRALFMDISDISEAFESSDSSSTVTYQAEKSCDDDASIASILENASSHVDGEEYYGIMEQLCERMKGVNVKEEKKLGAEFTGKHIRFVYDSDDDEIIDKQEEECAADYQHNIHDENDDVSDNDDVDEDDEDDKDDDLHLKGLPTPKGKHLRFADE